MLWLPSGQRPVGNLGPVGPIERNTHSDQDRDLQTWYPMREGGGVDILDRAGRNFDDGVLAGDPNWIAHPAGGKRLHFNGTNTQINCGNVQGILGKTGITIIIRFRADDATRGGLFHKNPLSGSWTGVTIIYAQSNTNLAVFINGSNTNISGGIVENFGVVGEECEAVIVLEDDNTLSIYKDGLPRVVTGAGTYTTPSENNQTLYLGLEHFTATNRFHGSMEDVRIIGRALTADEVLARQAPQNEWDLHDTAPDYYPLPIAAGGPVARTATGNISAKLRGPAAAIGSLRGSLRGQRSTGGTFRAHLANVQLVGGNFSAKLRSRATAIGEFQALLRGARAETGTMRASLRTQRSAAGTFSAELASSGTPRTTTGDLSAKLRGSRMASGSFSAIIGEPSAGAGSFRPVFRPRRRPAQKR